MDRDLPRTPVLDSPLAWATPADWVVGALSDPVSLLNDHAHLERKAATNALELLNRWPYPIDRNQGPTLGGAADRWGLQLASIARDEVLHLSQVLRYLRQYGGHFERSHTNPYAAALRDEVRRGEGRSELVDRLLVSALIEARSCERFELLAGGAPDPGLRSFYRTLALSERGHFRVFLDLAAQLPGGREGWQERWSEMIVAEAAIIQALPPGPAMHSGPPA